MQFVFAYGTLKSGHPQRPASCPTPLSVQNARAPGQLWLLPEGYPILQIHPALSLLDATTDPAADWARADTLAQSSPKPAHQGPWIEGELHAYPPGPAALAPLDEWENFLPQRPGPYQRRIIHLQDHTRTPRIAWAYVCQSPPPGSNPHNSPHWP